MSILLPFGSLNGGMFVEMRGLGLDGKKLHKQWWIMAEAGDGISIPALPACIVATKIVNGQLNSSGAYPCVGVITLEDFEKAIQGFHIKTLKVDLH